MHKPTPFNNAPGVPSAIGPYSQAMAGAGLIFLSGQIGLHPETGELQNADFATETRQVFKNLAKLAKHCGGDLNSILKLNVFVTDMANFAEFNTIAQEFLTKPYPARIATQAAALPKGGQIEIEAIMLA